MFRRIVMPVDFSEPSKGAIQYATFLASHFGAELWLLHVVHSATSDPEAGEIYGSEARQAREDLQSLLLPPFSKERAYSAVCEGDAARVIVAFARRKQADLIVMPTHGYGPFRRFLLGSVTAKVLHDAECPVLTGVHLEHVPAGPIQIANVACAVDIEPAAVAPLEWASRIVAAFEARFFVLHAIPVLQPQDENYYQPDFRAGLAKKAEQDLAGIQQQAGSRGKVIVVGGAIPAAVCSAASDLGADLLVIGRTTSGGPLGRLKTNAYAIIRESACPVISV